MKKFILFNFIILLFLAFTESGYADFWLKCKGPYGAKISRIAIDTSTGYIYLATMTDGVYRSTTNGQSWNSFNETVYTDDAPKSRMWIHRHVNDIAISATGGLYAVTDSAGIFKGTVNQNTWVKKTVPNNPVLKCIYILSNGNMLAGTNSSTIAKSSNAGDDWSIVTSGLSSVTDINAITQANNDNIFIGTEKGIYKISDNGQSWVSVDNNVGEVHCFTKSSNGLVIMAGTDKGIYASTNNGDSWNAQSSGMPANTKVMSLAYHKDGYFIAGTEKNGFFYSTPSTYVWTAFNTGLDAIKIVALTTNKQGEIFAASNFAFYLTPNTSGSWTTSTTGLGLRTINRFASQADKADVLAATDLGVFKTTNSGENWTQLNQGLSDNLDVSAIVRARNGNLFVGTKGDGLYFSTNQGASWNKLTDPNFTATDVTTLDTNKLGILWAGTKNQGVFKSNDMTGMSWTRGNGYNIESKEILSFVEGANNVTYAGTANDGLYRKTDLEPSWKKLDQTFVGGGYTINALAYAPIGTDGVLYAATNSGIRRSINNSLSPWNAIGGTLPNIALAITACENGWVLAGIKSRTAIYIDSTTKNGDTWVEIKSGSAINNYETQTFAVSGRGYIFAGTKGGGCYRSEQSTSTRILIIGTNQPDNIKAQQGDKISFNLNVIDGGKNLVSAVTVVVKNDMGLTIGDLTTNASGAVSLDVTIPSTLADGTYSITFKANSLGYIESEDKVVYIDVQRQKIFLDIDNKADLYLDWEQEYKYNIIAKSKDENGVIIPNISIKVDDKLKNIQKTLTTDAEGKAEYKDIVPLNHPEQAYKILFEATDPTAYYDSASAERTVVVDHNDIVINGPRDVCVTNTYRYTTEPIANATYTWKTIIGGTFLSPTSNTFIDIKWDTPPAGSFILEQKVGSTQSPPRKFDVTISDLPGVTLADFPNPICPNVPYELTGGDPPGGVYSGKGVNNGWFYGDSAGGQGTYPITYTYTSDVSPYCVDSATKSITVYALPNVTLNLDSTIFCQSYFPFLLTGGLPTGGTYSGNGVSNNILDPAAAPLGTNEITYTYTDGTTGCINSAKQNITINPAPAASINIPDPNICESITDYDLSDKGSEAGKFSGPGVNFQTQKFNAQTAGLGTHRLVFVTDRKTGNCPGMAEIFITVVTVPLKPTITPGPTQTNPTYLESSSLSGNTWYREGTIINISEGRNERRINPRISGNYTVTTTSGGCESFPSDPFNFTYVPPNDSLATELSEQGEILPGKMVTLDIKVGSEKVIKDNSIDSISFDLVYNASMLYPEFTPMGTVVDHIRTIPIGIKIDTNQISNGSKLISLDFKATVGSEESTQLKFNNLIAWSNKIDTKSDIGIKNLNFSIKVNKNSGNALLFGVPPLQILMSYSVMPNPAGELFKLDYSIKKESWIKIYITNINGQILKNIFESETREENNSLDIDASELNTGNYYLIIQTVFDKVAVPLHIIK